MALLELLLRVRQACCHGELVPSNVERTRLKVFEEVKRRGLDNMTEEECEALRQNREPLNRKNFKNVPCALTRWRKSPLSFFARANISSVNRV
jgi:hypothetical protein